MSLYNKIFAHIYDPFMAAAERKVLGRWRRELIGPLQGKILEVGAGTGVNFPYYSGEAEVLAIDPSEEMLAFAKRKLERENLPARIEVQALGIGDASLDKQIAPHSLDAIVSTLVLCTIPDPKAAFERFHQWLKPDGKLLALEHIHGEKPLRRKVEHLFTPVWKALAEGCHLNRDTDRYLQEAGFKPLSEKYFHLGLRWYAAELQPMPREA